MTPLQKIEQQRLALEKMSEYMVLFNNIVASSVNACKVLNVSFDATLNNELKTLVEKCYQVANDNNLNFDIKLSDYNYRIILSDRTKNQKPYGLPSDLINSQWGEDSDLEVTPETDAEWIQIQTSRSEELAYDWQSSGGSLC